MYKIYMVAPCSSSSSCCKYCRICFIVVLLTFLKYLPVIRKASIKFSNSTLFLQYYACVVVMSAP